MAPTSKANYKSFEAQARLIRAIVAAHPDTKWNYKGKTRLFFCSPPLLSLSARHSSSVHVLWGNSKIDAIFAALLEIVACFGSDMTEAALNHRFRPLRAEAIILS